MPVARGDQIRQKCLGAVDDSPEVDVDDALDVLVAADLDVTQERDARVVVDLVHLAEMRVDRIGVGEKRFPLRDVETVGFDVGAQRLELLFSARQTVGIDIADRESCSAARQLDGQRPADSRTGPGDDSDLAGECVHRASVARLSGLRAPFAT